MKASILEGQKIKVGGKAAYPKGTNKRSIVYTKPRFHI